MFNYILIERIWNSCIIIAEMEKRDEVHFSLQILQQTTFFIIYKSVFCLLNNVKGKYDKKNKIYIYMYPYIYLFFIYNVYYIINL